MFTMSPYSAVVLVHVTAATLLIGSATVAMYTRRAIVSATSLPVLRAWVEFGRRSSRANPALAFAVLASGVYLGSYGWWGQPWFYVAAAAWVLNTALAARVIRPMAGALGAAVGRATGDAIPPDIDAIRRSLVWPAAGAMMRASDLAMLYVMFTKPSLVESSAVILLAAVSLVVIEIGRERHLQRVRTVPAAA